MPPPYRVRAERDPQFRQPTYYVESVRDIPLDASAMIGDVIQNLRSALDHLAWHLVEIGCAERGLTLTDRERKQIGFPIIDTTDPQVYEASRLRKIKGVRDKALEKIDKLKPYKGGNDPLWQLSQLNNIDKHRFLLTAGLSVGAVSAKSVLPQGIIRIFPDRDGKITSDRVPAERLLLIFPTPIPLKKDAKLFVDVVDAEIEDDTKFRFEVALNEPGIVEGKPILPTLAEFRNCVNSIILNFRDDLS